MKKKINVKKIIKDNPLIKEKEFQKEDTAIKSSGLYIEQVKYNIIPPFSRRITTSA